MQRENASQNQNKNKCWQKQVKRRPIKNFNKVRKRQKEGQLKNFSKKLD